MNIKMKDVPKCERPRERLINVGVENLSDEELLAIILKTSPGLSHNRASSAG